MRAFLVIGVLATLALTGGRANAYPQFQLSKDQTCSGCHISPAGGGLLSENGANTAEGLAKWASNPEFMYGKIGTPDWLQLGGDMRSMLGYLQAPQRYLWWFPMQVDVYAAATKGNFTAYVTAGMRPPQDGNESLTYVWAREYYAMWQQTPGAREGLFVRAGHLMPVFGLRFVEHPMYVRRFGATPVFSETLALAVE
jgi:hypothetical protein